jgi:hypothetical protein
VERCVLIPFVVGHGLSREIVGGAAHDSGEESVLGGVSWKLPRHLVTPPIDRA